MICMILICLADGFEEIEALATVDILRRASLEAVTLSVSGKDQVTGAHGISVSADLTQEPKSQEIEAVILPGGMPGTKNLLSSSMVERMVRQAAEDGKLCAAICAAPSVLGAWGLLKGKKATCFPGFEQALEGAQVLQDPVVRCGNIVTSRGAGTAHLFAFELVAMLRDEKTAKQLRQEMQYE